MFSIFDWLRDRIIDENFSELPEKFKKRLEKKFPDEPIEKSVKSFHEIYRAPRGWIDSNLFYNVWLVVTPKRACMIRDNDFGFGSALADMPYYSIDHIDIDKSKKDAQITLESSATKKSHKLIFQEGAMPYINDVVLLLQQHIAEYRDARHFCPHCGNKSDTTHAFCIKCGKELKN